MDEMRSMRDWSRELGAPVVSRSFVTGKPRRSGPDDPGRQHGWGFQCEHAPPWSYEVCRPCALKILAQVGWYPDEREAS
jgi:hypothetical protein